MIKNDNHSDVNIALSEFIELIKPRAVYKRHGEKVLYTKGLT